MISMRIRLDGSKPLDWIDSFDVLQVPGVGDSVSAGGLTYVVTGRSWAFDKNGSGSEKDRSFCHVTVRLA
jgi:hypothetical protein